MPAVVSRSNSNSWPLHISSESPVRQTSAGPVRLNALRDVFNCQSREKSSKVVIDEGAAVSVNQGIDF